MAAQSSDLGIKYEKASLIQPFHAQYSYNNLEYLPILISIRNLLFSSSTLRAVVGIGQATVVYFNVRPWNFDQYRTDTEPTV